MSREDLSDQPSTSQDQTEDWHPFSIKNFPNIIPISCGDFHANLHLKLFRCPGVTSYCIEMEDELELITPKDLTVRANKYRARDWKVCIRIYNYSLRHWMDTNVINFYNHQSFCTMQCYLGTRYNLSTLNVKTDELGASVSAPPSILLSPQSSNSFGTHINQHQIESINNNKKSFTPQTISSTTQFIGTIEKVELARIISETDELCEMLSSNPQLFWEKIHELELDDEIINGMIESLNKMRVELKYGEMEKVAASLSESIGTLNTRQRFRNLIYRKSCIREEERRSFMMRELEKYIKTLPTTTQSGDGVIDEKSNELEAKNNEDEPSCS